MVERCKVCGYLAVYDDLKCRRCGAIHGKDGNYVRPDSIPEELVPIQPPVESPRPEEEMKTSDDKLGEEKEEKEEQLLTEYPSYRKQNRTVNSHKVKKYLISSLVFLIFFGMLGGIIYQYGILQQQSGILDARNKVLWSLQEDKLNLQTWLIGNKTLLEKARADLQSQIDNHTYTNTEYRALQTQIAAQQETETSLRQQITDLNVQIDKLQHTSIPIPTPQTGTYNVVNVNLIADDIYNSSSENRGESPFIYPATGHFWRVSGYVKNTGKATSPWMTLHVIGLNNKEGQVINVGLSIPPIGPEQSYYVSEPYAHYWGVGLTHYKFVISIN